MILRQLSPVGGIERRERAQAIRREQLLGNTVQHCRLSLFAQNGVAQRDREQLIGAYTPIISPWTINDIVERLTLLVPETRVEAGAAEVGLFRVLAREMVDAATLVELLRPLAHEGERVVPEGIYLDGLAGARSDRRAVSDGVHPGQCSPGISCTQ